MKLRRFWGAILLVSGICMVGAIASRLGRPSGPVTPASNRKPAQRIAESLDSEQAKVRLRKAETSTVPSGIAKRTMSSERQEPRPNGSPASRPATGSGAGQAAIPAARVLSGLAEGMVRVSSGVGGTVAPVGHEVGTEPLEEEAWRSLASHPYRRGPASPPAGR